MKMSKPLQATPLPVIIDIQRQSFRKFSERLGLEGCLAALMQIQDLILMCSLWNTGVDDVKDAEGISHSLVYT